MKKWSVRILVFTGIFLSGTVAKAQLTVTGQLEATSFTGTGITINGTGSFTSLTVTGVTGIPGSFIGLRIINNPTTSYTPTTGTKSIVIELVGGGAGGGGVTSATNNQAAGSGGGAGGYLMERIVSIGAGPFTVAVGAGGAGGLNTGANGTNGGNTTFNDGTTTYTAFGGSGGVGMLTGTALVFNVGGVGGVISTNGDVNGAGTQGGMSIRGSGTSVISGAGGSTIYGAGGIGRITVGANAGIGYGAGGGGALGTTANLAGGAGTAGVIVIHEYR